MRLVCDLHLHSRYSLATSPALDIRSLALGAKRVGIDLLAAPDFTHPLWREEMRDELEETQPGSGVFSAYGRSFVLVSEVSCIWRQDGRSRRVHFLITAPDIEAVEKMSIKFATLQNLESDGRPIFKISALDLLAIVRDADPKCEAIPAHVFTPWYGIFGAKSGFDSMEECFGGAADQIFAVETGLSSDPAMHWTVRDSRTRAIVSFSDAHSIGSLGREATVLNVDELSYDGIVKALRDRTIVETYEFHPEHGKYHHDGHRKCGVRLHPTESAELDDICPNCHRTMTLGVLNRSRSLSDGGNDDVIRNGNGTLQDAVGRFAPYRHLIPLDEILAFTLGVGKSSNRVKRTENALIDEFGSEFNVLLHADASDITELMEGDDAARAIVDAKRGDVHVEPGYDGVYGSAIPRSAIRET